MINRYLLACILSTCYLSNEVMASNARKARELALAKRQQLAAAAVAPVVNVDKPLADEGRALQRVNTLFGADPNATAPNILSGGIQGQITQVRALHGVGDLVGVANFNAEPYLTTLDGAARVQLGHVHDFKQVQDFVGEANFEQEPYQTALHAKARTQLGRVHALHKVDNLATVDDDALNDGEDNEFTTVLDNGLRHQMKGLQMVLKPSSIPDNLYQGQDGMGADFGARLKNFLTIATANDITTDNNNARQYVNELRNGIAVAATAAGRNLGHLGAWQTPIQTLYDKAAPTRADYLGLIRGMANDINHAGAFDRVYLLSPLKAIIRDMLIHFPQ